jgi:hypothetical protein
MKFRHLPSQSRIKELLEYEELSGVFVWKERIGSTSWKKSLTGTVAGSRGAKGIVIFVDGRGFYAHRLAWVYVHGDTLVAQQVDHKDCDCFNNRISNLRLASHGQNASNSRQRKGKALPKGVSTQTVGAKYRARIGVDGQVINLGTFVTPEDAHAAYVRAAISAKGEFARPR